MTEKLQPSIDLLRELVGYGANLIHRCSEKGGTTADLVVIGHFFKHAVTMLDGAEIQLSRGAVFASGVSTRSMLEAYMYLEWILKADTDNRARHFYVWFLRQKREKARRFIPGTAENKRFKPHLPGIPSLSDPQKIVALEADARKQEADLSVVLEKPYNKSINSDFDRLKTRHFDGPWYKPTGVNSIGHMAKSLSLESEYDFFYAHFSDITHASAFEKHVKIDGNDVIYEPIRNPEGFDTVLYLVATLAFRIYGLIINKYFPSELHAFNLEYVNKWRERFLSVPKVKVEENSDQ
jgi:hypothetical protein